MKGTISKAANQYRQHLPSTWNFCSFFKACEQSMAPFVIQFQPTQSQAVFSTVKKAREEEEENISIPPLVGSTSAISVCAIIETFLF